MDWTAIKTEYITTDTSYRRLAEKYGVDYTQIGKVGKKEDWVRQKKQFADTTLTKTLDKASTVQANKAARVLTVADKLLDAVEKKLDLPLISDGQAIAQEYRQLASTIKDIKDILMIKSDIDTREQEARIKNLERQAEKDATPEQGYHGVVLLPVLADMPSPPEEGIDG